MKLAIGLDDDEQRSRTDRSNSRQVQRLTSATTNIS